MLNPPPCKRLAVLAEKTVNYNLIDLNNRLVTFIHTYQFEKKYTLIDTGVQVIHITDKDTII